MAKSIWTPILALFALCQPSGASPGCADGEDCLGWASNGWHVTASTDLFLEELTPSAANAAPTLQVSHSRDWRVVNYTFSSHALRVEVLLEDIETQPLMKDIATRAGLETNALLVQHHQGPLPEGYFGGCRTPIPPRYIRADAAAEAYASLETFSSSSASSAKGRFESVASLLSKGGKISDSVPVCSQPSLRPPPLTLPNPDKCCQSPPCGAPAASAAPTTAASPAPGAAVRWPVWLANHSCVAPGAGAQGQVLEGPVEVADCRECQNKAEALGAEHHSCGASWSPAKVYCVVAASCSAPGKSSVQDPGDVSYNLYRKPADTFVAPTPGLPPALPPPLAAFEGFPEHMLVCAAGGGAGGSAGYVPLINESFGGCLLEEGEAGGGGGGGLEHVIRGFVVGQEYDVTWVVQQFDGKAL